MYYYKLDGWHRVYLGKQPLYKCCDRCKQTMGEVKATDELIKGPIYCNQCLHMMKRGFIKGNVKRV